MDKLAAQAGLVLGHVLQVDGLLQEDLPLDPGPVVSLDCIDHLQTERMSPGFGSVFQKNFSARTTDSTLSFLFRFFLKTFSLSRSVLVFELRSRPG